MSSGIKSPDSPHHHIFSLSVSPHLLSASACTLSFLDIPSCWFRTKISELQSSHTSRCGQTDVYTELLILTMLYSFFPFLFFPHPQCSISSDHSLSSCTRWSTVFITSLSVYLLSRSSGWWRCEADAAGFQYGKGKDVTMMLLIMSC